MKPKSYRERIRQLTTSTEGGRSEWQPTAKARGRVAMSSCGPMPYPASSALPDAQSVSAGVSLKDASTPVEDNAWLNQRLEDENLFGLENHMFPIPVFERALLITLVRK